MAVSRSIPAVWLYGVLQELNSKCDAVKPAPFDEPHQPYSTYPPRTFKTTTVVGPAMYLPTNLVERRFDQGRVNAVWSWTGGRS